MAATNTQMILLCMATLAFLNLAAGLIKSDAWLYNAHRTRDNCCYSNVI